MSYGQTHSETLPTVGITVGETYATMVNAVLTEMRATLNAKVTPAGIDVNADLSLRSGGTRYGLIDTHRVSLYQHPALLAAATYPAALYSDATGELYYNDASGNQISITSGGAIDVSSSGAITGGSYGSPVEVNWDGTLYHFYSAASTYSDIAIAGLRLDDGSSNYLKQIAAAMSGNYTVTWPAAVPATNNTVLTMSTAGIMAYSATPTVTSLTTTGAATVGGAATVATTLGVTGLITATAGVTAAANQHVTVSGTGKFKHGDRTMVIPSAGFQCTDDTNSGNSQRSASVFEVGFGTAFIAPVMLPAGTRVKSVVFHASHGTGVTDRTYRFTRRELADGSSTSNVDSDTDDTAGGYVIVTLSPNHTIVTGYQYYLHITTVNGATAQLDDAIFGAEITYDTP